MAKDLSILETDSERIPRQLAAGLASEYRKTIPHVKIPCGLCRGVLHFDCPTTAHSICSYMNSKGRKNFPQIMESSAQSLHSSAQHLIERYQIDQPGKANGNQPLLRNVKRALRVEDIQVA